mgnify:CR=1
EVRLYTPEIRLYSVDFPAPFGPIKECISPFLTLRLAFLIISEEPKFFLTFLSIR